jgi:hypothetical protein
MKLITKLGLRLNSLVLNGLNCEVIKIEITIPRSTNTIVCGILLLDDITAAANIMSKKIGIAYSNVANTFELSGVTARAVA